MNSLNKGIKYIEKSSVRHEKFFVLKLSVGWILQFHSSPGLSLQSEIIKATCAVELISDMC